MTHVPLTLQKIKDITAKVSSWDVRNINGDWCIITEVGATNLRRLRDAYERHGVEVPEETQELFNIYL